MQAFAHWQGQSGFCDLSGLGRGCGTRCKFDFVRVPSGLARGFRILSASCLRCGARSNRVVSARVRGARGPPPPRAIQRKTCRFYFVCVDGVIHDSVCVRSASQCEIDVQRDNRRTRSNRRAVQREKGLFCPGPVRVGGAIQDFVSTRFCPRPGFARARSAMPVGAMRRRSGYHVRGGVRRSAHDVKQRAEHTTIGRARPARCCVNSGFFAGVAGARSSRRWRIETFDLRGCKDPDGEGQPGAGGIGAKAARH